MLLYLHLAHSVRQIAFQTAYYGYDVVLFKVTYRTF